jgi:MFS family permease
MVFAASVMVFIVVRKTPDSEQAGRHGLGGRLVTSVVQHRDIFLSAGLAVIALQMVRQGRDVFLPLWGDSIGLDVAQIGLVFGASSLLDVGLFYPAGFVMDRWGRKWARIPSMLTLSLATWGAPATARCKCHRRRGEPRPGGDPHCGSRLHGRGGDVAAGSRDASARPLIGAQIWGRWILIILLPNRLSEIADVSVSFQITLVRAVGIAGQKWAFADRMCRRTGAGAAGEGAGGEGKVLGVRLF